MKYMALCGNVKDLPGLVRKKKLKELRLELEQIKKAHQIATDKLFKKNTFKN